MQRSIAISSTPKRPGGELEVRLFTMNDVQAELFCDVAVALSRAGKIPLKNAAAAVEKTVISMLAGKMPREGMPTAFHRLRLAFPVLRHKDVQALPRAGCPRGRISAIVMQMELEDGPRTVRLDLDEDQADYYNEAIRKVMHSDGMKKDEAWLLINGMIGRFLQGADLKEGVDDIFFLRAAGLFQGLTKEEAMALPLATEADVRRWSFTQDRPR